jgi:HPt (histidine-containing phosphotransfer) domain-containing protein
MTPVSPIDKEKAIACLGDQEIFDTMVTSFLEEVDQMMVVLNRAVVEGDGATIKEKAHWVKGGLVYLHATPSADAAKQLEMAVDLGPEKTKAAHEKLLFEVDRLKAALSNT